MKYNLEVIKDMISFNFPEVSISQSKIETLFIIDIKTKVAIIGITENNIKYLSNSDLANEIVTFINSIEEMLMFSNVNQSKKII